MNDLDKRAEAFLSKNPELEFQADCLKSFIAGAQSERERMAGLVEALEDFEIELPLKLRPKLRQMIARFKGAKS